MAKPVSKKPNTRSHSRSHPTSSPQDRRRELEPYLVDMFERINGAFFALDKQWCFTYLNAQAVSYCSGKMREELLGKNIWQEFPEAVGSVFYTHSHTTLATGQAQHFEVFSPHFQTWVAVHTYPSHQGVAVYFHALPERTPTEVERHVNEERFRSIWEHALDAMVLSDPQGLVLMTNPAYYQLYGYSPEDVNGKSFAIIFPEEQRAWALAEYQRTFAQPAIEPAVETTIQRKDGAERVVEARYHFVLQDGQRSAMVSVVRDITEQKRVQEAFQRVQLRAQRLMESNIIGVFIADEDAILESNDAFLEIVGYNRDDLHNTKINWSAMTPPKYAPLSQKALQELRERGACTPFEKEYIGKDGRHVPILIGAARLQEEPLQWVCFVLDMSERKALEQRKDEFLSMVSHELKTPLSNIWILTRLLRKQLIAEGFQDPGRNLSELGTQARQLMKLLSDVLEVSQLEAGYLLYAEEPFDMNSLLREIVTTLQQVSPDHTLVVTGTADTLVTGDRDRLGQVLTNLLTNAIKYSVGTGPIDVLLASTEEALTIGVRDYGIGISREQQSRIFERFYRAQSGTQGNFPGFGMGLYISSEIVKRHGGLITVESEEGKGSVFTVTLPIVKGPVLGVYGAMEQERDLGGKQQKTQEG